MQHWPQHICPSTLPVIPTSTDLQRCEHKLGNLQDNILPGLLYQSTRNSIALKMPPPFSRGQVQPSLQPRQRTSRPSARRTLFLALISALGCAPGSLMGSDIAMSNSLSSFRKLASSTRLQDAHCKSCPGLCSTVPLGRLRQFFTCSALITIEDLLCTGVPVLH